MGRAGESCPLLFLDQLAMLELGSETGEEETEGDVESLSRWPLRFV